MLSSAPLCAPAKGAFFIEIKHLDRRATSPPTAAPRMRLNQIKLSGFKSFAEPTTFQLPGQRVGVVGPNGCGKSNIMDAVRWVLGESKASELRGESCRT
jgi:flagellar biosynthesis/type III secretory pathway ATPase